MRNLTVLFLLSAIFFISPVVDDTFYSHMSKGRITLEGTQQLGYEQISFSHNENQPNLYWLYDTVIYAGYKLWGEIGWAILTVLMWSAAFAMVFGLKPALFALLTIAIYPTLSCSEHSILFILIALAILFTRSKLLWLMLPLQILWANLHPSFVFVPFVMFIVLWSQHRFRHAIYISVGTLLCSFVSPHPISIWVPALEANWSITNIALFSSPMWWLLILAILMQNYQDVKKVSLVFLLVVLSFIYPVWALTTIFMCGLLLQNHLSLPTKRVTIALTVLYLCTCGWHIVHVSQMQKPPRLTLVETNFARSYNDISCGGYLSFQLQKPIFIDLQQKYPNTIYNTSTIMRHDPKEWDEIAKRYDFDSAIIDHRLPYSMDLCRTLVNSAAWSLVYCNEAFAVYGKNSEDNVVSQIEDDESVSCDTKNIDHLYRISRFYFHVNYALAARKIMQKIPQATTQYKLLEAYVANDEGELEKAAQQCAKYIQSRDNNLVELQFLIATYLRTNNKENFTKVRKWLKYAMEKYPQNIEIAFQQAQLFHLEEDYVTALSVLQKITTQFPRFRKAQLYYNSIKQNQVIVGAQEKYVKQARLLMQHGKFKLALKRLQQVLALDENYVDALLESGKIYHKLKKYSEAKEHYERILRLIPKHKEALSYLAITLTAMGEWEEAKKVIDPIADEEAAYIQAALSVVNDRVIKELYKKLREKYSAATIVRLSKILAKEKRFAEAIKNFEKLSKPDAKYLSFLYFEQGKELLNNKEADKGIKALNQAIKHNSQHLEAHLLIGTIFLKTKEWEKARSHYTKVQSIDPSDPRAKEGFALVELGIAYEYQAQKKYQQTVEHFEKFVALTSDLEEKKRIQKRIEDLKKSLENFKLIRLKILAEKAENAVRRKDYPRAEKIHRAIISITANAPLSYYWLAVICEKRRDYETAVEHLKKALQYKPKYKEAHFLLSGLYHKIGKTDLSVKHLQIYKEQAKKE
ncbi:tetratricopeptide repeat protein [Candidatus Uabimicrobium amorphum]|uniref:Lipopolysaccharide assembly protein B n=1 Tax=Uabimicrobium amorphum TaxID=2596890 RepID=A0A5S9F6K4_UABAM|nr:tetratricopeptide repeat protein [Candidatus Uabimicrobium amorphum]BBM86769.1 lipopolysaccharide assembly protein B [Candidatus Uabimicrobium amorphum]